MLFVYLYTSDAHCPSVADIIATTAYLSKKEWKQVLNITCYVSCVKKIKRVIDGLELV